VLIGWPDRGSDSDCAAGLTAMTRSLSVRIAMPRSFAEALSGQAQICLGKRGMRDVIQRIKVTALASVSLLACVVVGGAGAAPPGDAAPAPPQVVAKPIPKDSPALFGMGAQPCQAFVAVAGETNSREIALSGAMFSWAQGWFSARNVVGHESAPRVVGGSLTAERLKSLLAAECRDHPDEALYLAVNDLYKALAGKGL
jgi:hypothetical protein